MTALHDKGLLLEEGVHLIEQQILRTESRVKDSELPIEARKIISHLGVRHEIDLCIRIVGARGSNCPGGAGAATRARSTRDVSDRRERI